VRFLARAVEEVAEIDAWWRAHRDASNLFAREFSETV
jgi:lipase chaperone LimK